MLPSALFEIRSNLSAPETSQINDAISNKAIPQLGQTHKPIQTVNKTAKPVKKYVKPKRTVNKTAKPVKKYVKPIKNNHKNVQQNQKAGSIVNKPDGSVVNKPVSTVNKVKNSVQKIDKSVRPHNDASLMSDNRKAEISQRQFNRCANAPYVHIDKLLGYKCPLWKLTMEEQGRFDEAGFDVEYFARGVHAL